MKLLIEIENNRVVRQIQLKKSNYTIGRDSGNDIVFNISQVSKKHAELVEEGDTYVIRDLGSTNHVYVNGERVPRKKLTSGDTISISRAATLLFIAEGALGDAVNVMIDRLWEAVKKKDFLRLKEVTRKVISLEGLDTILDTILSEVTRLVGADRGFIALADEYGVLKPDAFVSHNLYFGESALTSLVSNSTVQRAIREKKNICILNTHDPAETLSQSVHELNLGSIMCSPLQYGEKLVGVLYVDSGYRLTDFDEMDQFCFGILADHAAIAIENAKLYDQLKEVNQFLKDEFQESEQRYSNLAEVLPEAVFVQCDGRIVFANPAAVELLRAEKIDRLVGNPVLGIFCPECRETMRKRLFGQADKEKHWQTLESRLIRCDQEPVEIEITVTPMAIKSRPGALLVARDITQRRKMEKELLKAEKLESISTLAGGLAHDFNNILMAIVGHISLSQIKLAKGEHEALPGLLERCEKACMQAKTITQQLLTFARGGVPVKKVTSLAEILQDSASFMTRGSNVRCAFSLPQDLWAVEVDEGQIGQVVANIVLNAIQAMPAGGLIEVAAANVTINDDAGVKLRSGNYVKISFRDQGVGIPGKILQKIFDPFFTTKQQGSGLGLATAYSIIAKHGGAISVESVVGTGSTFHVYLPARQETTIPRTHRSNTLPLGTGRVLIMDDQEEILEVAGGMIKAMGFEVQYARDGNEAVELYRRSMDENNAFDVVIMDLTVPDGMGGEEAIKKMIEIDPKVKAIVSSGYSNDSIMANFSQYGFKGVVAKPYSMEQLAAVVQDTMAAG